MSLRRHLWVDFCNICVNNDSKLTTKNDNNDLQNHSTPLFWGNSPL